MALEKRIGRVLRKNRVQYAGSMLLIMLGSILFMVLNAISFNLSDNLKRFVDISNLEDVKFVVQKPIDIKELEKRYNIIIEQRMTTDYKTDNGAVIRLFEKTDKINIPAVVDGKNISDSNEIMLNPAFANAQHIHIGDKIEIMGQKLIVTGFMSIPDYIYPTKLDSDIITDPNTFGIGVVSKEFLQNREGLKSYYSIKYLKDIPSDIKSYINDNYGLLMWQDIKDNTRYTMVKGEVAGLKSITVAVPVCVFVLTCLLLCTVVWRMVKMEFVQIGSLYAIGYRRKEILRHYLSYPLVIAASGSIAGTLVSFLIEKPALKFYIYYYNLPILKYDIGTRYMACSILLPVIILVSGVSIVVWRALKLTPLKLMRGCEQNKNTGWIEKRLKLNKMGFSKKFVIRESARSIPRMLILTAGVAAASMLLLLGFTADNTFDYILNQGFKNTYAYKYNYVFSVPQVKNIYNGDVYNAASFKKTGSNDDLVIYGIEGTKNMVNLTDEKGNKLNYTKNTITKALAQRLNVKRGDSIMLTCGLNDKQYEVKIDNIADLYTGSFIYMPLEKFNKMLGYEPDAFIGIFAPEKISIDDALLLKTENADETISAMNAFFKPLRYALSFAGVMAFLIAILVMYIIIAIIIEESKPSISMLKVLGYSTAEIKKLILGCGNIPVIVGYLLGVPLIYKYYSIVIDKSLNEVDMVIPVKITFFSVAVGFIIVYIAYELTKIISYRKIVSTPMSDSLKSQRE